MNLILFGRQQLQIGFIEVKREIGNDLSDDQEDWRDMLIGWGFRNYVPDPGFEGQVFAVITGKGAPQDSELALLERYLAERAGIAR